MAGRSHGIIGYDELVALELSSKQIRRRVRSGWMTELFLGAFLVGHHNVTRRTYWKASIVSCGDDSVSGFRSAAQLTVSQVSFPDRLT